MKLLIEACQSKGANQSSSLVSLNTPPQRLQLTTSTIPAVSKKSKSDIGHLEPLAL